MIPVHASIDGIKVEVRFKYEDDPFPALLDPPAINHRAQLWVDGARDGDAIVIEGEPMSLSPSPTGDSGEWEVLVFGGSTELWGLDGELTWWDINDIDDKDSFGVAYQCDMQPAPPNAPSSSPNPSPPANCFVDSIKITVYYTAPPSSIKYSLDPSAYTAYDPTNGTITPAGLFSSVINKSDGAQGGRDWQKDGEVRTLEVTLEGEEDPDDMISTWLTPVNGYFLRSLEWDDESKSDWQSMERFYQNNEGKLHFLSSEHYLPGVSKKQHYIFEDRNGLPCDGVYFWNEDTFGESKWIAYDSTGDWEDQPFHEDYVQSYRVLSQDLDEDNDPEMPIDPDTEEPYPGDPPYITNIKTAGRFLGYTTIDVDFEDYRDSSYELIDGDLEVGAYFYHNYNTSTTDPDMRRGDIYYFHQDYGWVKAYIRCPIGGEGEDLFLLYGDGWLYGEQWVLTELNDLSGSVDAEVEEIDIYSASPMSITSSTDPEFKGTCNGKYNSADTVILLSLLMYDYTDWDGYANYDDDDENFIIKLFNTFFDDDPTATEISTYETILASSKRREVFEGFFDRADFCGDDPLPFGRTFVSNEDYVIALYRDVLEEDRDAEDEDVIDVVEALDEEYNDRLEVYLAMIYGDDDINNVSFDFASRELSDNWADWYAITFPDFFFTPDALPGNTISNQH